MNEDIVELKQAKHLALTRNENSVFYGMDEITKSLIGKFLKISLQKWQDLFCHLRKVRG